MQFCPSATTAQSVRFLSLAWLCLASLLPLGMVFVMFQNSGREQILLACEQLLPACTPVQQCATPLLKMMHLVELWSYRPSKINHAPLTHTWTQVFQLLGFMASATMLTAMAGTNVSVYVQ